MIQEIVILRTVFPMTVDEAFNEPGKKNAKIMMEISIFCKTQHQKLDAKKKFHSSTCELSQQPGDAF